MPERYVHIPSIPKPESVADELQIVAYLMHDVHYQGTAVEALSTLRLKMFLTKNPWAVGNLTFMTRLAASIKINCGSVEMKAFLGRWKSATYYVQSRQSETFQGVNYEMPQPFQITSSYNLTNSYEAFPFTNPLTASQRGTVVVYFMQSGSVIAFREMTLTDRLVEFFTKNPWAAKEPELFWAIVDAVHIAFGAGEKFAFEERWKIAVSIYKNQLQTDYGDDPSEIQEPEEVTFPYQSFADPMEEFDWTQGFQVSPHRDQILSAILPDRIILVKGGAILESELILDTPCNYKAMSNPYCHNIECRITTLFWTNVQNGGVLDVLSGERTTINPHDRSAWINKHKDATVSLCKETGSGWACECGTVSSNGLLQKLSPVGYKCIRCYLTSIHRCDFCSNYISANYNGKHVAIDGEYMYACKECLVDLKQCSSCGHNFKTKPLLHGRCMACTPSSIYGYTHKPEPIFWGGESEDDAFMGIEVEVEMKEGLQQYSEIVAHRFQEAVGTFAYLKKDSSISKGGFEIVSHPATLSHWHQSHSFWDSIKKLTRTCESWSVDNCGMHVHISRDAFQSQNHTAKFLLFINSNRLLSAFVAERYNAKQAPFMDLDLESAKKIAGFVHKIDRHCAVNVQHNIPTVEVRIFKGNLKKQRMLKNIEFVHSVFTFTQTKKPLEVDPYIEHVGANKEQYPNLYAYISKYKRKF